MNAPREPAPPWRQVFDRVERLVGRPLEDIATSQVFVDVMITGMKARRSITGAAGRVVGGAVNTVLRSANVATRDDMRRLTRQVADLATEVRAGTAAHARPGPSARPAARERPATQTPAKKTPAKKTPATKTPATKTPATKTPATKTPATKTPATKTSSSRGGGRG